MEGLFEQNPWLLIPIIVAKVEAWSAFKRFLRAQTGRRREQT